jgi:hypothetical protein
LLAHAHVLRGRTDDRHQLAVRKAEKTDEEGREPCEELSGASEDSNIAPGIEILFHRQKENVCGAGAPEQLGAIGVSFPAHVAEQFAITGAERDEVTTAAMIRAENKFFRRQLSERVFDIERAKARAIAAHRDDFVVTESGNRLDRIFEALRKPASALAMNPWAGTARVSVRREKMNVNRKRKFGGERGKIQQRPRRHRERAPGQIDMRFLGEEENGASGHALGYETAQLADKPFLPFEPEVLR